MSRARGHLHEAMRELAAAECSDDAERAQLRDQLNALVDACDYCRESGQLRDLEYAPAVMEKI